MLLNKLSTYVKLTETEEKDFKLLFIQSLLAGFGAAFFFVVANAYFIQKTSVAALPGGYIMSGVFGYLLITVYKKLQNRFGVISAYTAGFIVYGLAGLLLFWGRIHFPKDDVAQKIVAYVGFVTVLPFAAMQVLGFSTVCLRVFNIAQSKRLLALIGTGEVIASILAYIFVPFLVRWLGGNAELLVFSAAANIMATLPLRKLYHISRERFDIIKAKTTVKMGLGFFRRDRFFMYIAIATVFSVAAVYFADYAYLLSVRHLAKDDPRELSRIIAWVFSLIKLGELVFSIFSARILRSYGMKISLLALPVLLVVSSFFGPIASLSFGIPEFVLFFLLFNKWLERVIRKGMTIPAMKVMYQVTEPHERARLQATIDGTINQFATIGAGVVLWVLSRAINSADIPYFLQRISFVYLAVFAGWMWITFRLFGRYKHKIREYLRGLQDRVPALATTTATIDAAIKDPTLSGFHYHEIMERARSISGIEVKEELFDYILFYNPALKNYYTGKKHSLQHLKRAYYSNENFFSRLLIIWHMEEQPTPEKVKFVKEYYGISELQLRVQMLEMLAQAFFRAHDSEAFFFTGLCQDNATEMMRAYSTINDLSGKVSDELIDAIQLHIDRLRGLMFSLLKVLYDKKYIRVVQEVFRDEDKSAENLLFAVELLDNLLDPEMKKMILPLFEDCSYGSRKDRLQKIILVYQLPPEKRLRELLMSDFMTVSPHVKELTLAEYYRLTHDHTTLSAFAASSVENLSATARMLLNEQDRPLHALKMSVIDKLNLADELDSNSITYFAKWGLFPASRRGVHHHTGSSTHRHTFQFSNLHATTLDENGTKISLDILGLSLLFKLNKQSLQ